MVRSFQLFSKGNQAALNGTSFDNTKDGFRLCEKMMPLDIEYDSINQMIYYCLRLNHMRKYTA